MFSFCSSLSSWAEDGGRDENGVEEGGREDSGVEVEIGVEKHLEVLVDEWVEDCKVEEAGGEESLVGKTSSSASKVGAGAD